MCTALFLSSSRPTLIPLPYVYKVFSTVLSKVKTILSRRCLWPLLICPCPMASELMFLEVCTRIMSSSCNVSSTTMYLFLTATKLFSRRMSRTIYVVVEILPTEATGTKSVRLICRTSIRTKLPAMLSSMIAQRIIQVEGTSRTA